MSSYTGGQIEKINRGVVVTRSRLDAISRLLVHLENEKMEWLCRGKPIDHIGRSISALEYFADYATEGLEMENQSKLAYPPALAEALGKVIEYLSSEKKYSRLFEGNSIDNMRLKILKQYFEDMVRP